jgi:hypothetical protein
MAYVVKKTVLFTVKRYGLLQLPMSAGPASSTSCSRITKGAAEKIARKLAENWRIEKHATLDSGPGSVYWT